LIVEDSEDDAMLLLRELRRCGYEPLYERVQSPEAMSEALTHYKWDVIISDYRMPRFGAPQALSMAREAGSEAPFVVVSGMIGEELAVEVMRSGAYDYVMKDNLPRLCATVERGMEEAKERRERKRIEEELRGSQERYRAVIEQATDGIYLLDAGTKRIVETNPSFQGMLGYTADELRGMEVYDFVAHSRENIDAVIGRTLVQKRRLVGGRRYRRKDGSLLDVEVGVSVIPVGGKEIICTIVRDVTDRLRSETALKSSEARHRAVVDTALDAVITMSSDGVIRSFNAAAERIFGYEAEEAIGQQLELLMPERFRKSHRAGLHRYLKTGDAHVVGQRRIELEGRRKNGAEFPLELSIAETREGENVLFIGIVRDITERKDAEEALRQSERLWRTVIEQATENIFLVDGETGRIVESNSTFQHTLGYGEEELKGMTIYDIVAHDKRSVEGNLRRVFEQGRYPIGERKYRRKDGSLVDVEVNASTILRHGRPVSCVVAHDVTERARAQRLLEERVASLSRIAANLTFDLPTQDALDAMAEYVVNASTAVACGIVLMKERADTLHVFGSHGLPEGYTTGLQAAYRAGVPSPSLRAFRTRKPVFARDFRRTILAEPLYAPIHRFIPEVPWDTVRSSSEP
jgi:PAS domain S-box-containing protein